MESFSNTINRFNTHAPIVTDTGFECALAKIQNDQVETHTDTEKRTVKKLERRKAEDIDFLDIDDDLSLAKSSRKI